MIINRGPPNLNKIIGICSYFNECFETMKNFVNKERKE